MRNAVIKYYKLVVELILNHYEDFIQLNKSVIYHLTGNERKRRYFIYFSKIKHFKILLHTFQLIYKQGNFC